METPDFAIRSARPDADAPAEHAVVRRAFRAGPYGHLPVSEERAAFEADTSGRAASGEVLLAVESDGRIIGSASVLRALTPYARVARPGEAEMRLLAVDPDAQGRGVGAALMRAALETALGWGAEALVLDTGRENLAAQRLYERLGFERVPEREWSEEIVPFVYRHALQERPEVRVRLMRAGEADAVGRLTRAAYEHDYEIGEGYRSQMLAVAERASEHLVWVAEDAGSGELLGTVSTPRAGSVMSPVAADGELDFRLLAVAPAARRRGIGALLTRHVLRLAELRGANRVVMNSGPEMTGAHRLYEGLGFTRIAERERTVTRPDGSSFLLLAFGRDVA